MTRNIFKSIILGSNFDHEILTEKRKQGSFVIFHLKDEDDYIEVFGSLESSHDDRTIFRDLEDRAESVFSSEEELEDRIEKFGEDDPHFYSYWMCTPIHFNERDILTSHLNNSKFMAKVQTMILIVEGNVHSAYSRNYNYHHAAKAGISRRDLYAVSPEFYERIRVPNEVFNLDMLGNAKMLFGDNYRNLADLPEDLRTYYSPATLHNATKTKLSAYCLLVLSEDFVVHTLLEGVAEELLSIPHLKGMANNQKVISFKCPVMLNSEGHFSPNVSCQVLNMRMDCSLIIGEGLIAYPMQENAHIITEELIAELASVDMCQDMRIILGSF